MTKPRKRITMLLTVLVSDEISAAQARRIVKTAVDGYHPWHMRYKSVKAAPRPVKSAAPESLHQIHDREYHAPIRPDIAASAYAKHQGGIPGGSAAGDIIEFTGQPDGSFVVTDIYPKGSK